MPVEPTLTPCYPVDTDPLEPQRAFILHTIPYEDTRTRKAARLYLVPPRHRSGLWLQLVCMARIVEASRGKGRLLLLAEVATCCRFARARKLLWEDTKRPTAISSTTKDKGRGCTSANVTESPFRNRIAQGV